MPQSFASIHIHLVFSTKDRSPAFQNAPLRSALHKQLGGISNHLKCQSVIVGGVEDHVHLLCRLDRSITVADWVKEIKRASNKWLREQGCEFQGFEWQRGYAAFSVSQSNVKAVRDYIANQEEHHRKQSFQDELRLLLTRHELTWEERYIWD